MILASAEGGRIFQISDFRMQIERRDCFAPSTRFGSAHSDKLSANRTGLRFAIFDLTAAADKSRLRRTLRLLLRGSSPRGQARNQKLKIKRQNSKS